MDHGPGCRICWQYRFLLKEIVLASEYRVLFKQMALDLRDEHDLKWFVETGSYFGITTRWAAENFENVIAIEIDPYYFRWTQEICRNCDNLLLIGGDSGDVLEEILGIVEEPALIWLDAHFSPAHIGGANPLLKEIQAINADGRPHVILIDDFRYFEDPPTGWPSVDEIMAALGNREIEVEDDVIKAVPSGVGG